LFNQTIYFVKLFVYMCYFCNPLLWFIYFT